MSSLFLMVTITDRRSTDAFLQLYQQRGVDVNLRTVGSGTAVRETLATLGLEKTEKAVLLAVVTEDTWKAVRTDLRRKMRIDVPGTGIAFTVPLSSIGGRRALMFLTQHQPLTLKEESTLKDTRYELLLVIANQGHTGTIMDAARAAGAGGGTVIHAKGTGMEGAAQFLGVELVNEKELVLIVARTPEKNRIMKAIMDGAGPKAGAIVFSPPVCVCWRTKNRCRKPLRSKQQNVIYSGIIPHLWAKRLINADFFVIIEERNSRMRDKR